MDRSPVAAKPSSTTMPSLLSGRTEPGGRGGTPFFVRTRLSLPLLSSSRCCCARCCRSATDKSRLMTCASAPCDSSMPGSAAWCKSALP